MPASHCLAALALAAALLVPLAADAMDADLRAASRAPTGLRLCGTDGAAASADACKDMDLDALTGRIESALQAALSKAPATIRPLLKRDQVWFNETMLNAADSMTQPDDDFREAFVTTLRQRAATLEGVARGFGHSGVAGRWVNAFGSVTVIPADGGYRLAIDTSAVYGTGSDRRRECKATALVKPVGDWLSGIILPAATTPADVDKATATDEKSEPAKPPAIKMRRQGGTLRIVVGGQQWRDEARPDCEYLWQITASYFADGKPDAVAAADKADASFVVPSFDCTRPDTASEEEICADPDLADNDRRLNRAWKTLLPRLDATTRRALSEDQRNWVRAQTRQYPQFLHPAWEKQSSIMHFTADAREKLDRLQRERIALLDGFDDRRSGLAGLWLGYNAILKVTPTPDGGLKADGWKWEQGDWKAGCDFEISGKVVNGVFRSAGGRKNPDTLERDHASLIVNRQDDILAKKRDGSDDTDPAKCRRNITISSTARLFPARPSPDIDNPGGSIR